MAATPSDDDPGGVPAPPNATPPPAPSTAALLGRAAARRFVAARRLALTAKESAKDPTRRQAAIDAAGPALGAALDSAGLRNDAGKVDVLKVAQAARNPGRAASRVGAGLVTATAGRLTDGAAKPLALQGRAKVAPTDEDILGEWAVDDPEAPRGLVHLLAADPMSESRERVTAIVRDTLGAVLGTVEEGWSDEHDKVVRLALAVARRFGLQPEELGGSGELGELFEDRVARMRMAMALARNGWSCDLSVWFLGPLSGA